MAQQSQSSSYQERIAQVRTQLVERLRTFRPGPRTYITAFCIGATIGEYAALTLAGGATPQAILAAIGALSTQLGVNLLADIIGDREPPPGLKIPAHMHSWMENNWGSTTGFLERGFGFVTIHDDQAVSWSLTDCVSGGACEIRTRRAAEPRAVRPTKIS